ncbi:MAG: hypothetical protein F4106_02360 [Gemmatimonadetes bacterium]|nr:hypothetical protein [Gemmatimonadota bacterium]MYC90866.1 hypothetical protein [Gemmatimonadota bacterium]MYJ16888.1 hypothetical protein [Gemmatimonadota bacterium]
MERQDGDSVLRAKYRDYCSARVADAILSLSPEEIYSLARSEARSIGHMVPDSYNEAIRLATGRIRNRLALPEFEEWALEYRNNPDRFDPYILGLWKSEEPPSSPAPTSSDPPEDS